MLEYHPDSFKDIPYAISEYCRLLFNNIGKKYDDKKCSHVTTLTPVHKLSYKLREEVLFDTSNYYNMIITS